MGQHQHVLGQPFLPVFLHHKVVSYHDRFQSFVRGGPLGSHVAVRISSASPCPTDCVRTKQRRLRYLAIRQRRKYLTFDVTSVGQCLSPWLWNRFELFVPVSRSAQVCYRFLRSCKRLCKHLLYAKDAMSSQSYAQTSWSTNCFNQLRNAGSSSRRAAMYEFVRTVKELQLKLVLVRNYGVTD